MSYGVKTTIDRLKAEQDKIIEDLTTYVSEIGYKRNDNLVSQKCAWNKEIQFLIDVCANSDIDHAIPIVFEYMLPNENTERPDVLLQQISVYYSAGIR